MSVWRNGDLCAGGLQGVDGCALAEAFLLLRDLSDLAATLANMGGTARHRLAGVLNEAAREGASP